MTSNQLPPLLKNALLADGALVLAAGIFLRIIADFLAERFGLPTNSMHIVGTALIPWAGFVIYLGLGKLVLPAAFWVVIAGNALWVLASFVLLATGWLSLTPLGTAFLLLQALVVAGFAAVQFYALRRLR